MATILEQLTESKALVTKLEGDLKASNDLLTEQSAQLEKSTALIFDNTAHILKLSTELGEVKTSLVASQAKVAELEASIDAKALAKAVTLVGQSARGGVAANTDAPAAAAVVKTFEENVKAKVSEGLTKQDAVRACIAQFPEQYKAALARGIRL